MAFLIGMTGSFKGRKFDIDQDEITLGRRDDNRIPVNDTAVSGYHCTIIREGQKFTLRDLESTNGTRLNGAAVHESRLRPKDIVQLGEIELMFDGDDVETAEEEAPRRTPIGEVEVTAGPSGVPNTFRSVSPFGARRDSRRIWVVIIAILAIGVLFGLGKFLIALFE